MREVSAGRQFEEVVLAHRQRLYRRALSLCRSRADAEDLLQETYLRAFRSFDRFTPGTNCAAWLLTIMRNTFLTRVARAAREGPGDDEGAVERALARGANLPTTPEEEFFRRVIDDKHLAEAVKGLPGRFREVVILADVEDHSYREIAQMCELPIGTVMSRLFRGHRLLRKALRDRRGGDRAASPRAEIAARARAPVERTTTGRGQEAPATVPVPA